MEKKYFGPVAELKRVCNEINSKVQSITPQYMPVAKLDIRQGALLIFKNRIPNSSKCLTEITSILNSSKLVDVPN